MFTIPWNFTHLIFLLSRSRFNIKIIFIKHWPIATPKFVPKSKMPKFSLTDASNMPILILQSKINFLTNLPSVSRHFSHVTKSRIFKNLNLREKADRNFRRTFLKNRFRHLKLYSNPPSWLARGCCHMGTFWKTKDWSSHFWEGQPFRFWYVECHRQRRLKSTKTGISS